MSNCTHSHEKAFSWLPTTLIHNEHKHECSCIKCYLSDIVATAKIEFVWMSEYIALFTIFEAESDKLKKYSFCSSFTTRSPPLYK